MWTSRGAQSSLEEKSKQLQKKGVKYKTKATYFMDNS